MGHPVADAGSDQLPDRAARRFGARFRVEAAVPDLLPDGVRGGGEQPLQPFEVGAPGVLRKVRRVGFRERTVDPGDLLPRPGLREPRYGFGQSADEQVLAQPTEEPVVRRRPRRGGRIESGGVGGEGRFDRAQELREGHRPQVEELDPPHRHRERVLREGEFEQGAGGDHRDSGALLVEVAKGGQRVGRRLDLVQEEDRPFESPVRAGFEGGPDPIGVEAPEDRIEIGVPLEVHFEQAAVGGRRKLPDQGGLADLAGAADDQRLAAVPGQPAAQDGLGAAFHWNFRILSESGRIRGCFHR